MKILAPDGLHFHERNFRSLLTYINKNKCNLITVSEKDELKALYGNYSEYKSLFLEDYDNLVKLNEKELFEYKFFGINLFKLAKTEMLAYLMSRENWFNDNILFEDSFVFNKAYKEDKEDLILNMAAVSFWLKFWHKRLSFKNYRDIQLAIIFSGSLIYVKTLSSLLQNTSIKVFVVEHFFTGNDYYFEEKYEHIANNSDIKFDNIFNNLVKEIDNDLTCDFEKEKIKAINKINLSNNKNVKQPFFSEEIKLANNTNKTVLIVGQVVNDFSILETKLDNINSLSIYKKLILEILNQTDFNIIFKAHPWERNKINLKRSLTKDELIKFLSIEFSKEERKRIVIVEDFNIVELFNISDYIIGICSQALLEAAFHGKKVFQIGDSFFGNRGFTYDCNNIDSLMKLLIDSPRDKLSLNEYNNLLNFFTILLQKHLVSIYDSGEKVISKKLKLFNSVKLIAKKNKNHITSSVKNNDTIYNNKDNSFNEIKKETLINEIIKTIIITFATDKRIKRFEENPKKYFIESNKMIVKVLGKLYNI